MHKDDEQSLTWVDRGVYLLCVVMFLAALFLDWGSPFLDWSTR